MAHELACTAADDRAQAETALTLAIVLNRLGEFRDALAQSLSAAGEFEKRGDMPQAARGYFEAAWANSCLGHLKATLENAARAREKDLSPVSQARCDWIGARALRDQGNYPEAEELFERSRAVFESAGMPLDAARCTRELAHVYVRGERPGAAVLLQSARQIFESAQCAFDVTFCDFLSGVDRIERASYSDAESSISQARDSFLRLGAEFFVAWCNAHLGVIYLFQNLFEESLEASHLARDYFLTRGVVVEVSACDINIGLTCDALNRYDQALTFYQEAADLSLEEGREVRAGRIHENMGSVYAKQGLYAKALELQERALEIYSRKALESLVGNCLVRLAIICRQLGQYGEAMEHLRRAHAIFSERDLAIQLAECEFTMADVHFALYETSEANVQLHQARKIYAENGLESLVAVCDRLLACLANQQSERIRALSLVSDSRATFQKQHQIVDVALCDLTEGELRLQWNEQLEAEQAFVRALAVLSPGFPDQAWRVEAGLGDCAKVACKPLAAIEHYLNAMRIIAQSRSILVTEQLSNDYFSSRQSVYDRALKIAMELDAPEIALEIVEASKARVFLSLLQNRRWHISNARDDPTVAQLLAREKELRYQLDALRTHATVTPPKDKEDALRGDTQAHISIAELQELNALSHAYESVVARLRLYSNGLTGVSAPSLFALDQFREVASARLGTDWAALDYYLSGDDLTCIVVQPTRVSVSSRTLSKYDRGILDKCVSQEHDLREIVYNGTLRGEPTPSPGLRYLSHLYHLLVPEWLDAETLLIAPHGALHALPFHALRKGDDYLIQHHTLIYTPSLQALQYLLVEEQAGSAKSLAVGLSEFGDQMRPLPYASTEIEQFQAVLGGQAQILWDDRATRKELLALDQAGALQDYALIHFATHAILDRTAPHRSRVLLRDEPLTILDIMDLRLNARLVTLSACETALGQGGRGDELVGLARAFFHAGARALVASLWQVQDRSIAELMGRFYRRLADGENIAVALRHAQVEMIQANYSPFQWASLALMGRP
ncbi:MAG: CHAT domain-containing protein [Chloroflexi bacterium]|nr:CHAT domain-containing protein [Chloroflexota bacterium]